MPGRGTIGGKILVAERLAEMVCGATVLFGPEVGERQVEPHPRQARVTDQHGAETGAMAVLPILPCHRDRAVKEIQIVDIPFSRLDASEQKLRVPPVSPLASAALAVSIRVFGGDWRARRRLRPRRFGLDGKYEKPAPAARPPNGLVYPRMNSIRLSCKGKKKRAPDPLPDRAPCCDQQIR